MHPRDLRARRYASRPDAALPPVPRDIAMALAACDCDCGCGSGCTCGCGCDCHTGWADGRWHIVVEGKGPNARTVLVRADPDLGELAGCTDIDRLRRHENKVWKLRRENAGPLKLAKKDKHPASAVRAASDINLCSGKLMYLGFKCPGCSACSQADAREDSRC